MGCGLSLRARRNWQILLKILFDLYLIGNESNFQKLPPLIPQFYKIETFNCRQNSVCRQSRSKKSQSTKKYFNFVYFFPRSLANFFDIFLACQEYQSCSLGFGFRQKNSRKTTIMYKVTYFSNTSELK